MPVLPRRSALLAAPALGLAACSIPPRGPAVPTADLPRSTVLGVPNERFQGTGITAGYRAEFTAALARQRAAHGLANDAVFAPGLDFLAVSGGGEDGAFGAGVLTAWENRPTFHLVTGVSTGALTAPFAYLGPDWDDGLREVYTRTTLADIAVPRPILAAILNDGMADTAPLFRTISRLLDERMLAALAAAYREGRLLFVGTTNLDSGTPVIWNIGAIAASGHPRALDTIRKVLLASAAIPGAFPPVLFDAEVAGRRYQELHVDGGAIAQTFLYPPALGDERRAAMRARRPVMPVRAWVIRNGRLDASWATTDRRAVTIASRAVSTMIAASGYFDAQRIWLNAERDAVAFRATWIGPGFDVPFEKPFDPTYMRALFDYGQRRVREGTAWAERPPQG